MNEGRGAFWALFRALTRTAGQAAFQRAAPLYAGIGIVSAIVFAGNGMNASDMTRFAVARAALRVPLWAVFLLGTLPAARALLATRSTFLWRTLPVPRAHFLGVHALHLLAVELPWTILWGRGAGLLAGCAATVGAMAAHMLLLARVRGPVDLAAVAVLGAAIVAGAPPPVLLPCALFALSVGLPRAFARAPERSTPGGRGHVSGGARSALLRTYLLVLWREESSLLLRASVFCALGLAVAVLAARNNGIVAPEAMGTLSLTLAAPMLFLGAGGMAGAVQRSERRMGWLLDACGTGGGTRVVGTSLALAVPAALLGLGQGLLLATGVAAPPLVVLRLGILTGVTGIGVGILTAAAARWAVRGQEKDSDRMLVFAVAAIVAAEVAIYLLHEGAAGILLLSAIGIALRSAASAAPGRRWLRLRQERETGDLP